VGEHIDMRISVKELRRLIREEVSGQMENSSTTITLTLQQLRKILDLRPSQRLKLLIALKKGKSVEDILLKLNEDVDL
jgi:hypothetical protein